MVTKDHSAAIAERLTQDLELDIPPIQISFTQEPPSGMRKYDRAVPSWCTFWADARKDSFYVPFGGHDSCEIGAFVLGMPLAGPTGKKLMDTLSWMQGLGYLQKGEEAKIPHLQSSFGYAAYGPLGKVPAPPSAVVLFAKPSAAMVAMEATNPGAAHPFPITLSGRPACAVIPTVLEGSAPVAMSLGCGGFRTFVEPGNDKMLIAVRGDHLQQFSDAVHEAKRANEAVSHEMGERKKAVRG